MRETILVTGATGNVGRELVRVLVAQGRRVRAAVHGDAASADALPEAAERVRFDYTDAATHGPALDGVTAVFLVRPPAVADVRGVMGPFIRCAAALPAPPHVVTLSVMGAGGNPLLPHHAMEKAVARAGLPFTHLRPSFFMQNLSTTYRADVRDRGVLSVPAGRGRTSFVDVRDVAEAAACVLGRPEHHAPAYTLTGAEALTYPQVAETFTRVLGRPVRYLDPSPRAYRRELRAQGVPDAYARVLSRIYLVARLGLAARRTPELARLLGRPPGTLERFVRDHAALWTPAPGRRLPRPRPDAAAPTTLHASHRS